MGMTNLLLQVQNSAAHGTAGLFVGSPQKSIQITMKRILLKGFITLYEKSEVDARSAKNCPTTFFSKGSLGTLDPRFSGHPIPGWPFFLSGYPQRRCLRSFKDVRYNSVNPLRGNTKCSGPKEVTMKMRSSWIGLIPHFDRSLSLPASLFGRGSITLGWR